MRFAVYDEIESDRETAARLISEYYGTKGFLPDILQFKQAEEFTGLFQRHSFSAVFIGINNMGGVDAAWVMRGRDKICPLIIMSGSGDYSLEGYRLEAADYLLKPLDERKFYKALDRLKKHNKI